MPALFRTAVPLATVAVLASLLVPTGPAEAHPGAADRAVAGAPSVETSSNVVPVRAAPHAVAPSVKEYAVTGVSAAGLKQLPAGRNAGGRGFAALSAPEPATGFAVTGVTWVGRAPAGLALAIRTRTGKTWSGWTPMEYDADHGPSSTSQEANQARPGTDPFVVGDVDDVQLRVTSDTGAAPTQMKLSVIDPGTSAADVSPKPISPSEASAAPAVASRTGLTSPVATRGSTPMPKGVFACGLGRRRTAARLLRGIRRSPRRLRSPHRQREQLHAR